jgi:DNA-binding MarR family transcriptional regulator
MSLADELGPPPRIPQREFAEAWALLITEARSDGRVDARTPLKPYRPDLILAFAQAPSEGLYVASAAEAVGSSQSNISRTLKVWVSLGLIERYIEQGDPAELGRARRAYYRITDQGRVLARILED